MVTIVESKIYFRPAREACMLGDFRSVVAWHASTVANSISMSAWKEPVKRLDPCQNSVDLRLTAVVYVYYLAFVFNEMFIIFQNYYFSKATYRPNFMFSDAIVVHTVKIIFHNKKLLIFRKKIINDW